MSRLGITHESLAHRVILHQKIDRPNAHRLVKSKRSYTLQTTRFSHLKHPFPRYFSTRVQTPDLAVFF